jgi:hypothetical protein
MLFMTVEDKILENMQQLSSKENRVCFTPKHFINISSYDAVKKALERLVKSKKVRRVARGVYDIPYESKLTGIMSPDISKVVDAIADRDKIRVQPTGAQAANLLGLSEQVPAKVIYLTDGRRKEIIVGSVTIIFKPTGSKDMSLADTFFGLMIQALKYLGQNKIDDVVIKKVKRMIKENPNEEIEKKLDHAPIWIAELLKNKVLGNMNV